MLGLQPPNAAIGPVGPQPIAPVNVGGFLSMRSQATVLNDQRAAIDAQAQAQMAQPVIINLAAHIESVWTQNKAAKADVEREMIEAVRSRRGEYAPDKLAKLKDQGEPLIYMMLFSVKARQAGSLLRDVLIGSGSEKPWTLRPTPVPELPPMIQNEIMQAVSLEIVEAQQMGYMPSMDDVKTRMRDLRDQMHARLIEEARVRAERMEDKMEDQLVEGGFLDALDAFIDDLTTFKAAFIKGPIVRRKPVLSYSPQGDVMVKQDLVLEWERGDPFMMYPAPYAKDCNDAPFIELVPLTRSALNDLIGVEGFSEPAIRKVLEVYGQTGHRLWTGIEGEIAAAEGRTATTLRSDVIDCQRYWGSVPGRLLREWGLSPAEVDDLDKEYQVEAWKIGSYVIKAVLNGDPLARRPYYKLSYEEIPGSFWGNSLYDLMRDCQDVCNAAARGLVANMGLASGPQVWVNSERMPPNEDITTIFPWKVWQGTSDPNGSTAKAIEFFQPNSNAAELMAVFERFSDLADEYTGIPKYMTGAEGTPGAGRTASGLSMMIGNASKIIKQIITKVDVKVLTPLLERLFYYNVKHNSDPDLKGDVRIVARGAMSLVAKDAAQVRRNEFLMQTANPIDMQIIGLDGRAELLRATAKSLDIDADRVVPPVSVLKQRQAVAQLLQAQMAAQQPAEGQPGQASQKKPGSGQQLQNGAPVADTFQPTPAP